MSKFKAGDKVIVLNNKDYPYIKDINKMVGKICEIRSVISRLSLDNVYCVYTLDKKDCWYFNEDQLELVLPYEIIKVTKENKNITVRLQNGKVGKAHCKENDTYNEGIGIVIATARAYGVDLQDCADLVSEKKEKPDLTELKSIIERATKFLKDNEKPKYKITFTEFLKSKKLLGIYCNTEEKANTLLKAFNKLGKKWIGVGLNLDKDAYKEIVFRNDFNISSKSYFIYYNKTMYNFEEVDLEN